MYPLLLIQVFSPSSLYSHFLNLRTTSRRLVVVPADVRRPIRYFADRMQLSQKAFQLGKLMHTFTHVVSYPCMTDDGQAFNIKTKNAKYLRDA